MKKLFWSLIVFLSACAVLTGHESLPAPRAFPVHSRSIEVMKWRLDSTNVVADGTVTKVKRNWDFEDKCGVLNRLRYGCNETSAWEITIKGQKDWHVMAFAPHGDFLPIAKGMEAIFFLRNTLVAEIGTCAERQAATSAAPCQTWNLPIIVDTMDIYPRSDSVLIDSLWTEVQKQRRS